MYIGRDDSEPVRTRVSEFANVRVYSNAEDKTAFPWLSELNTRASRLNYSGERERESAMTKIPDSLKMLT